MPADREMPSHFSRKGIPPTSAGMMTSARFGLTSFALNSVFAYVCHSNPSSIAQVMRNSGCEVPDYMLNMKKSAKNQTRQPAQKVPHRQRISTEPLIDQKRRERRLKKLRKAQTASIKKTASKDGQPKGSAARSVATQPAAKKRKIQTSS